MHHAACEHGVASGTTVACVRVVTSESSGQPASTAKCLCYMYLQVVLFIVLKYYLTTSIMVLVPRYGKVPPGT